MQYTYITNYFSILFYIGTYYLFNMSVRLPYPYLQSDSWKAIFNL